jgi:hypothetical protein
MKSLTSGERSATLSHPQPSENVNEDRRCLSVHSRWAFVTTIPRFPATLSNAPDHSHRYQSTYRWSYHSDINADLSVRPCRWHRHLRWHRCGICRATSLLLATSTRCHKGRWRAVVPFGGRCIGRRWNVARNRCCCVLWWCCQRALPQPSRIAMVDRRGRERDS